MANEWNTGGSVFDRRWRLLKACWVACLMATWVGESAEPNADPIEIWWVLDASGTLSIPATTPGLREICTLDFQHTELPAVETQIRHWAQEQSSQGSWRLSVLLNGVLQHDPFIGEVIWRKDDGSATGIPMERILRYASRVDPEFALRGVFTTDQASFAAIADKLNRWMRGSSAAHQILLLTGPESARFEAELLKMNPFLPDEKHAAAASPRPSGGPAIGAYRWQWDAGKRGQDDLAPPRAPGMLESGGAEVESSLEGATASKGVASWELNFDANGGFVRTPAQVLSEKQPLVNSLSPTKHAINGFGLDLLQHPEWIPEGPTAESVIGLQNYQEGNANAWILWLLPRNLDANHEPRVVLQINRGLLEGGRLWTRFHDGRLTVTWESQGGNCMAVRATDVALVQGVWNLLILHFEPGSQAPPRLERPHPATWFEIPEWRPPYDPELDSPAVRQIASAPHLILDSVRSFESVPQALAESLSMERYARFAISQLSYSDAQDLEKSIRRESAGRKQLADWDNLKACFAGEGARFVAHYSIEFEEGYLVKRAGERWFGGNRHYFFNRFDHHPRQTFLVHDTIENHLISLGSWVRLYLKAFCETVHPEQVELAEGSDRGQP